MWSEACLQGPEAAGGQQEVPLPHLKAHEAVVVCPGGAVILRVTEEGVGQLKLDWMEQAEVGWHDAAIGLNCTEDHFEISS